MQNIWLWAFSLNFILIFLVQGLPVLTKSGWVNAGILGTILWGCLGWRGWLSVVIYLLLGYLVTKLGFAYKQSQGIAEGRGGLRGPENVWGSAFTGAFLAIIYRLLDGFGEQLIFVGYAASFAAKLSDTFGSEIGKRWGKKAFLITTLKPVTPGTDGAISIAGTFASLLGSFLMTLVMYILSFLNGLVPFIVVVFAGFFATILESFIGAIFQNRINWLTNEVVNGIQTGISALLAMTVFLLLS